MATHPEPAELRAYLANTLDPAAEQRVQEHLDSGCEHCNEVLTQLEVEENGVLIRPPSRLVRRVEQLDRTPLPAGPPPLVPGYRLLDILGRGGMAVVYRACAPDGRLVALKVIPNTAFSNPELIERFLQEGRLHQQLSDLAQTRPVDDRPPLIEVYEIGQTQSVLYISMELATGGTLRSRLAELRESPDEAVRLVAEVAEALAWLHEQTPPVFHRDLKPSNILLQSRIRNDPRPRVSALSARLADLGVARRPCDPKLTETGALIGTVEYMAPELLKPGQSATPATEVYALGATLYELLNGRPPFVAGSHPELLRLISLGHPPRPSGPGRTVPADLERICLKCLELDPGRRYPTARALAADLRRFLHGEPVQASFPPPWRRAYRWGRKHPAGVVAILLLVTAAIVSTLLAVTFSARARQAESDRDAAVARDEASRARAEQAESDRDAVQARAEMAHAAIVTAARTAAPRGDWVTALPEFNRAIGNNRSDALRLRVERLPGYFFTNRIAELQTELEKLEELNQRNELGLLAPKVKLLQGMLWLSDSAQTENGRGAIREALDAAAVADVEVFAIMVRWVTTGPLGADADRIADAAVFSTAERFYAAALLETTPRAVIRALEHAVQLDPFHQAAQTDLLFALIAAGQLDDARRQLTHIEKLFPRLIAGPVACGLLAAIDGDRAALAAALDGCEAITGEPAPALREFLTTYADLLDLQVQYSFQVNGLTPQQQRETEEKFAVIRRQMVSAFGPGGFAVPIVHQVFDWYQHILPVLHRATFVNGDENAYRAVLKLIDAYPDSIVQQVATTNRFNALTQLMLKPSLSADEVAAARRLAALIAHHGAEAGRAPTIEPRAPRRYISRNIGLIADAIVLRMTPDPDPVHFRRLREHGNRIIAEGRTPGWAAQRDMSMFVFVNILVYRFESLGFGREWRLDTPEGVEVWRRRHAELYRFTQGLIDAWASDGADARRVDDLRNQLKGWASANGFVDGAPDVAPPPRPK